MFIIIIVTIIGFNQQPLNEVNLEKDNLTWRINADNIKENEKYVECIFRISVLV